MFLRFAAYYLHKHRNEEHGKIQNGKTKHKFACIRILQKRLPERYPKEENQDKKRRHGKSAADFKAEKEHREIRKKVNPDRAESVRNSADDEKSQKREIFQHKRDANRFFYFFEENHKQHVEQRNKAESERDDHKDSLVGENIYNRHGERYNRKRADNDTKNGSSPFIVDNYDLLEFAAVTFV